MSRTLFLSPPSFDGFDGGAGSRYQARREVTSFWYPTWLAQPAALVPDSKLLDCPPHDIGVKQCLEEARQFDHVIINTSTPSLKNDCKVAEAIKRQKPATTIGFVGAHAAVLPAETLKASAAIDWVGRKEFDFTCKEVAEGRPLSEVDGLSYRNQEGKIIHNQERALIADMDVLPWVVDTYKRDLQIEKYFIGYLLHPYLSLYTGRGCPAQCTFCLWPQTIGGHKYRVRSPENVAAEMAYAKKLFPQVREFFFDDDTFTANLPRAREIAKRLAPLGVTWSCNSRANLDYDTIKSFKESGPAPLSGRLRKRQPGDSRPHQKRHSIGGGAAFHPGLPQSRRGHSRHVYSRPAGGNPRDDRANHPLRHGAGCFQHPGFAGRPLSRHRTLRHGPAKRLVRQTGQDRHRP